MGFRRVLVRKTAGGSGVGPLKQGLARKPRVNIPLQVQRPSKTWSFTSLSIGFV